MLLSHSRKTQMWLAPIALKVEAVLTYWVAGLHIMEGPLSTQPRVLTIADVKT